MACSVEVVFGDMDGTDSDEDSDREVDLGLVFVSALPSARQLARAQGVFSVSCAPSARPLAWARRRHQTKSTASDDVTFEAEATTLVNGGEVGSSMAKDSIDAVVDSEGFRDNFDDDFAMRWDPLHCDSDDGLSAADATSELPEESVNFWDELEWQEWRVPRWDWGWWSRLQSTRGDYLEACADDGISPEMVAHFIEKLRQCSSSAWQNE